MSTFKIVVTGTTLPGHEPDEVKARIAALFKLTDKPQQLERLFAARAVSVKKGLSEAQARSYLEAIERAGLGCEMVAEAPPAAEALPPEPVVPGAAGGEGVAEPESAESRVVAGPEPAEAGLDSAAAADAGGDRDSSAPPMVDSWTQNPYQQPEAELSVPQEAREIELVAPKKLTAGAGLEWIREGYGYFKMNPWSWIGMMLLGLVVMVGAGIAGAMLSVVLPPLSILIFIAFYLLTPVFAASLMLACYELHQGERFGVGELFAGFRNNLGGLLAVGAIYTGLYAVIMAISLGGMMMQGFSGNMMMGEGSPLGLLLYNLLVMALSIPVMMSIWFAPALVAIHGLPAVKAMGLSFKGCLRNMHSLTVYGLVTFVLAIIASIPMALGWLVLMPVVAGSIFAGYRQIFTRSEPPQL